MSLIEAARTAGWRVHDTMTSLLRHFNEPEPACFATSMKEDSPLRMIYLAVVILGPMMQVHLKVSCMAPISNIAGKK
jgi:hypothetical protein